MKSPKIVGLIFRRISGRLCVHYSVSLVAARRDFKAGTYGTTQSRSKFPRE